jgi:hypothetical protein
MRISFARAARRLMVASAAIVVTVATGCTTYVQPTSCAQGSTTCGGVRDARFCEYEAEKTAGPDCASSGLAAGRRFYVVTSTECTDTRYAVMGKDCRVLAYRELRDGDRAEDESGVPVFDSR